MSLPSGTKKWRAPIATLPAPPTLTAGSIFSTSGLSPMRAALISWVMKPRSLAILLSVSLLASSQLSSLCIQQGYILFDQREALWIVQ